MGIFSIKRARARETVKHPISLTFPIRKNPNSGQQLPKQITPSITALSVFLSS
ncbi:hypothetical protein D3C73_226560 [compost metagenome]